MPDNHSPKIIGNENFPVMAFESTHNPVKWPWTCPGDQTIAAYVDGALRQNKKRRVEVHLAKCERCRMIVADVVKLQREIELPVPPFEVARQPIVFAPKATRSRRIWAPAAAMALTIVIAAIFGVLRRPQKLLVVSPPSPSAPMIAKVDAPDLGHAPVRDITRKPPSRNIRPVIVSPLRDSSVRRDEFEIRWKPLSRSRYYGITVVTSDGDLLWESQTQLSVLRIPSEIKLKRGSYFVWITAYLPDGQVAKSSPVRFVVER
jgi:hypothetical protein